MALAKRLKGGDRLDLYGDLGGGKTTFVRGLVRGLGHPEPRDVASPTFALHHRYIGGRLPVDHLDLYRLDASPETLARQGILDPLEDDEGICCVEWAERMGDIQGPPTLRVRLERLSRGEDYRELHFELLRPQAHHRFDGFAAELKALSFSDEGHSS